MKLRQLIRKEDFFDEIVIDKDFMVRLIRKQKISKETLIELVQKYGVSALKNSIREYAYIDLIKQLQASEEDLMFLLHTSEQNSFILPIEVDKERLSNGEKQIFVMALYWAIMQQSQHELPFVIDTPFARIDTEHRANITEHFFSELKGQLLVLSTNEELNKEHLSALKNQITKVYLLEYGDDQCTHVMANQYFEV
ncbi:hypothetical protein SDC9_192477 [bioreactor metagenome]|uniref:DNA replication and repair protein RecF n=1 Tax=bioreactor metagenome TaxID=1076179 RepID=A0A645I183_9ZZZZ